MWALKEDDRAFLTHRSADVRSELYQNPGYPRLAAYLGTTEPDPGPGFEEELGASDWQMANVVWQGAPIAE